MIQPKLITSIRRSSRSLQICTSSGILLLQNTQTYCAPAEADYLARAVAQTTTTYDSAKAYHIQHIQPKPIMLKLVDTAEAYHKICTSSGILLLQITLTNCDLAKTYQRLCTSSGILLLQVPIAYL